MNIHKNARLTYARRLEMAQDVLQRALTLCAAAAAHNVSVPTVRKWVAATWPQASPGWPTVPRARSAAPERLLRPRRWRSSSCAAGA